MDVAREEGQVTEDSVHHPLKGDARVSQAKTAVIKCENAEERGGGGHWNILRVYGDLLVALQ